LSEYGFKISEHNNQYYRIQLWDIAGQDKNAKLTKTFAKDSHGAVVMCDATNPSSREETLNWKKSVDEMEEVLKGMGLKDPCVVILKDEEAESTFYLYFDLKKTSVDEAVPKADAGSTSTSQSMPMEDRIEMYEQALFGRIKNIERFFDVLPSLEETLTRKGVVVDAELYKPDRKPFETMKDDYNADTHKTDSLDNLKAWEGKINKFVEFVRKIIIVIVGAEKEYPPPIPDPHPLPPCNHGPIIEKLNSEVQKLTEENKKLKEEIERLKSQVEPRPVFLDPGIKGKTLEFEPVAVGSGVVFRHKEGAYKYYFIKNELATELHLDTSKPVKFTIDDFEHRCSTDEPAERIVTKQYGMPKGEDYYLCTGKVVA